MADYSSVEQPHPAYQEPLSRAKQLYRPGQCHHTGYCLTDDYGDGFHELSRGEVDEYVEAQRIADLGYRTVTHDENGTLEAASCPKCGVLVDRKLVDEHEAHHVRLDEIAHNAVTDKFDWRYIDGR